MADIERDLRAARPDWPGPTSGAEARARAALGLPASPRSARSWVARASRRRGTLIVVAALLVTGGAAVAATIIGGGSTGAPAPRAASLDFSPTQTIDTPVSYGEGLPAVAVDGRGVVILAWGRAGRIVVSSRAPGGEWSEPERLSDPATRGAYPRIGADRQGAVTVVWRQRTAGDRVVEEFRLPSGAPAGSLEEIAGRRWAVVARTRPMGGAWAPPERVSPDTATVRDIEEPGLVVSPDGAALATWDTGGTMWASRRPPDGAWEAPVVVGGGTGEAVDPRLAASPAGGAILVWSNRVGLGLEGRYEIRAAVIDAEEAWREAEVVDDSGRNPPHASGAVNSRGDAAVAWISEGPKDTDTFASTRPARGDWSTRHRLGGSAGLYGLRPGVVMDPSGRAVVVAAPRGAGSTLGADGRPSPLRLSPLSRGRAFGATATPDATGAALVVRGSFRPAQTVVERVVLGAARPGPATEVSGLGTELVVAAGPDGTAAVAWISGLPRRGVSVSVAEAAP